MKYMNNHLETTIKEFDGKFARINDINRGQILITDITGTKIEAHTNSEGVVTEIGGLSSIKDFLITSHINYLNLEIDRLEAKQLEFIREPVDWEGVIGILQCEIRHLQKQLSQAEQLLALNN